MTLEFSDFMNFSSASIEILTLPFGDRIGPQLQVWFLYNKRYYVILIYTVI